MMSYEFSHLFIVSSYLVLIYLFTAFIACILRLAFVVMFFDTQHKYVYDSPIKAPKTTNKSKFVVFDIDHWEIISVYTTTNRDINKIN